MVGDIVPGVTVDRAVGVRAGVGIEIAGPPGDGDNRCAFVVEELHRERVEVQRRFAAAEQADDGDAAVGADDLHGCAKGGPRIGGEDDEIDALAAGEFVEFGLELGIVVEEVGVGAHPIRHLHANGAVGDADDATAKEGTQSDGAQSQDADPYNGHIFAGTELGFVIAVGAESVKVGVDGILIGDAVGDDNHALRFGHNVLGLVGRAGHDSVADLHTGHVGADGLDDAQVAVADPTRVSGRAGHLVGAFIVAPIGADFQGGDAGLHPDFVVGQLAHVQLMLFDTQIARAMQDCNFHTLPPFTFYFAHACRTRRYAPGTLSRSSLQSFSTFIRLKSPPQGTIWAPLSR